MTGDSRKQHAPWTAEVIESIRELAGKGMYAAQIARALCIDKRRIKARAAAAGFSIPSGVPQDVLDARRPWKAAELDELASRYSSEPAERIAQDLGRSTRAVHLKANRLGLEKFLVNGEVRDQGRRWTDEEVEELRRRYPDEPTPRIAADMGRKVRSIYLKAHKLGLSKSEAFHQSEHTPRRRFRGADPTFRRMGDWRISRGQLQRKVGPRQWEFAPRAIWLEHHGTIPPGLVAVFKEGLATRNPAEATIDRIELVTRAELMRRNSRHTRYGPEYNKIVNLRMALERKIKNITERNPK